jgi:hypothetical protein
MTAKERFVRLSLSRAELAVLNAALAGYEPDTASYYGDGEGWSPEEARLFEKVADYCMRAAMEDAE